MIEDVAAAVTDHNNRAKTYRVYRDYYAGRHELQFASTNFREQHGRLFDSLRKNLCPAAVTAVTDRLTIDTWGSDEADQAAEQAGITRLVASIHTETVRCGDAYALTWPGRDGTPKARYHAAGEIVPHVDPYDPDRLDWAAKPWIVDSTGRVNVYYADRVERWRTVNPVVDDTLPTDPGSWTPHADDDGPDTIRHDFGAVPVCWFKRGGEKPEDHGTSILADLIPLQDALNKGLADILVLSETYARPFWYLLNYQPAAANPLDRIAQYGQAVEQMMQRRFDPDRQRIVTHDGPGPFGQLNPPDLSRLLEQQQTLKEDIAAVVGIPAYYFSQSSGQVPSGESLRVLSSRLVSHVSALADSLTPVWRGQAQLLGLTDASPRWADPMGMDDTERFDNALKLKSLGLSLEDIVGYLDLPNPDEVLQRARDAETESVEALGRSLAAGRIPNTY